MANEQMGMAAAAPAPEELAIFDQMRQNISPKEFSDEMLASASQADPQAVAQFKKELDALDVPPEVLDALNNLVDEILANPDQYDQIRQKYMDQGIPEDILPEQFDPHFFAALNMAIDQLIAAPAGPQAFAKGGIAELKPIAKAIAGYGRNGDTMLAHITPAEARMLKRRGGSGTTNPDTGLPEFWNPFKAIGKAVKSFVNSTVGRIVTTVALGFFLGPAAASMLGVGSAAGVAAVSGFVGSAGATLLGGGNIRDALKAGAIGGLTAGVTAGVTAGFDTAYTGPTTVGGQWDKLTGAAPAAAPAPGIAPTSAAATPGITPDVAQAPTGNLASAGQAGPLTGSEWQNAAQAPGGAPTPAPTTVAPPVTLPDATAVEGTLAKSLTPTGSTSLLDQAKDFYTNNLSPSGIRAAAEPAAQQAGMDAMEAMRTRLPNATPAMLDQAYQTAYKAALPGVLSTYGPVVGAGLGIMGLTGGFSASQPPSSPLKSQLMKPATQRIAEEGTGRQYYVQGLPGVKYDQGGAPLFGEYVPLPTAGRPDYSGGFPLPGTIGGLASLTPSPAVYSSPAGTIGSRRIAQPYNTADMYSNLLYPQRYASGGVVTDMFRSTLGRNPSSAEIKTWKEKFGDSIDESEMAQFREDTGIMNELARQKTAASEQDALLKAKKAEADQKRAMRKAQGSGTMYANINAGLAARAPEVNPMDSTDTTFGARNRAAQQTALEQQYGSMFAGQRNALNQQTGIMASGQLPRDISGYSAQDKGQLYMQLARQGLTDPQIRAAAENAYGAQSDYDWKILQGVVGQMQQPGFQGVNMDQLIGQQAGAGNLPSGWSTFSPQQKINYFNQGSVTPDKLSRLGVEQKDMDWMYQHGYTGMPGAQPPAAPAGAGNVSIQGGFDQYGNLYGSKDYHYGRGPAPATPPVSQSYTGPNLYSQVLATGMLPTGADKSAAYQRLRGQGASDAQIRSAAETMLGPQSNSNWDALVNGQPKAMLNAGGIASLATGGYPRMNGQISGPGTEKSDSIPAMLSDGEFVMTAKAVRGAGKGNRREGAKKMYQLMHQLERNAQRG